MEVAIIGGGAIGLLTASYIDERHTVTIYTRTKKQAESLQAEGIVCKVGDKHYHRTVHASCFHENKIHADIYIVAVKQYHIEEIFPTLLSLQGKIVLFVQNGMGHIRDIEQFQVDNIGVGIVGHGATKQGDRVVNHNGKGSMVIGNVKGTVREIEDLFVKDDFPVQHEENWEEIVMQKLIVNAVINPLTALYRVKNGMLISNLYFFEMMKKVFEEVYQVVGDTTEKEAMWQLVLNICERTGENKSSMLRDVEHNRETEIESILGYVVKKANEKEIDIPILTFIYISLKGVEEGYRKKE